MLATGNKPGWQLERDLVERQTERAYLFAIPQGVTQFAKPRFVWLPKSQVTWRASQPCYPETAHIPAWLARKSF